MEIALYVVAQLKGSSICAVSKISVDVCGKGGWGMGGWWWWVSNCIPVIAALFNFHMQHSNRVFP